MPKKKNVKFGLFPKFLFSFIIIAIIPMLVIEFLSYKGMENLREDVVDKSRTIITQLSTTNIRQKAVGTAKQLEVYFKEKRKTSLSLGNLNCALLITKSASLYLKESISRSTDHLYICPSRSS